MPKPMTREQIAARYQSGFGRGSLGEYRPWIKVRDFSSDGVSHRILGRKSNRMHQFLSSLEANAFHVADWLDSVVDIREQFPLWPLEETEAIAVDLSIAHPSPRGGGVMLVTTDLLLDHRDGTSSAIAVKPKDHLICSGAGALSTRSRQRILEKLEIERHYWLSRGVSWSVVDESVLPPALVWNLRWLTPFYRLPQGMIGEATIDEVEVALLDGLSRNPDRPLCEVCSRCDSELRFDPGNSLSVVRHLLSVKRWRVPLDQRIDSRNPLAFPLIQPSCATRG